MAERIGDYVLQRRLGGGAFGDVYLPTNCATR